MADRKVEDFSDLCFRWTQSPTPSVVSLSNDKRSMTEEDWLAVMSAIDTFTWSDTAEGGDFWGSIHSRLDTYRRNSKQS